MYDILLKLFLTYWQVLLWKSFGDCYKREAHAFSVLFTPDASAVGVGNGVEVRPLSTPPLSSTPKATASLSAEVGCNDEVVCLFSFGCLVSECVQM